MAELQKGASFWWVFKMVDETDFATPITGATVTTQISKDGATFVDKYLGVLEIGSGWYKSLLANIETDADVIILKATASGCAQTDEAFYLPTYVVPASTSMIFTSPVVANNEIVLYYGDDYEGSESLSLQISAYDRYDLTNATGSFRLLSRAKYELSDDTTAELELTGADCTISQTGSDVTVTVAIEGIDLTGLLTYPPKSEHYYQYQVLATTSANKIVTLIDAPCTIKKKLESAS